MSWKKYEKRLDEGPFSAIASSGCLIAFAIGFVMVLTTVFAVFGFVSNPFKQAARVVNKTIEADNMIYNYEWFKQRKEDVDAIESKITLSRAAVDSFVSSAGDREDWHREDREEHSRLSTVLLGLEQQRADLVAEYNARSAMANRSIFKAGDIELPERIEL